MNFFLLLIMTILTSSVAAKELETSSVAAKELDCSKHKIYCHIKKLKPEMNHNKALTLSNLIYKYSKQYGTDPHISVAIGMQESGLKEIHAKTSGLHKVEVCDENNLCWLEYQPITIYTDLSIFQFHYRSINIYRLNQKKILEHDLDHIVHSHIRILAGKIKNCQDLGQEAWVCYHSRTPVKRNLYYKLVKRYL